MEVSRPEDLADAFRQFYSMINNTVYTGAQRVAFSDDGKSFSLIQVEGNTADCCQIIVTNAEFHFYVLCGQDNISVVCHVCLPLKHAYADRQHQQASDPQYTGK